MDDWRLRGQEKYLAKKEFVYKRYTSNNPLWDYDHCEFCNERISLLPEDRNYGYTTLDDYYWICEDCFNDFKDQFGWTVVNDSNKTGAESGEK